MLCSSCNEQRAELHPKNSKLIKGIKLVLCNECIKAKREPRWLIILCARTNGPLSVVDWVTNRRYVGKEITGAELLVRK